MIIPELLDPLVALIAGNIWTPNPAIVQRRNSYVAQLEVECKDLTVTVSPGPRRRLRLIQRGMSNRFEIYISIQQFVDAGDTKQVDPVERRAIEDQLIQLGMDIETKIFTEWVPPLSATLDLETVEIPPYIKDKVSELSQVTVDIPIYVLVPPPK